MKSPIKRPAGIIQLLMIMCMCMSSCSKDDPPPPPGCQHGEVTLSPGSASVLPDSTVQFAASVCEASQSIGGTLAPVAASGVDWTINGIPNGDASVGTINPTGLYTAPAWIPSDPLLIVKAISCEYPSKSDSAEVTVPAWSCPSAGQWGGNTSQGKLVTHWLSQTEPCGLDSFRIEGVSASCGISITLTVSWGSPLDLRGVGYETCFTSPCTKPYESGIEMCWFFDSSGSAHGSFKYWYAGSNCEKCIDIDWSAVIGGPAPVILDNDLHQTGQSRPNTVNQEWEGINDDGKSFTTRVEVTIL